MHDVYPRRFDAQATIDEIVSAHGEKNREELDAARGEEHGEPDERVANVCLTHGAE